MAERALSGASERSADVLLSQVGLEHLQALCKTGGLEAFLAENGNFKHLHPLETVIYGILLEGDLSDWPQEAQSSVCGTTWESNAIAYKCRTCEVDPTCAICVDCFRNGDHSGHDYSIIRTGGGCCDCGDEEAWAKDGFCTAHAVDTDRDASTLLENSLTERLMAISRLCFHTLLNAGLRPEGGLNTVVLLDRTLTWLASVVTLLGDGGRHVIGQALLQPLDSATIAADRRMTGATSWLHCLMLLAGNLPPAVAEQLQRFLISLLGDAAVKIGLARLLIDMYELEWKSYGSESSLLGLSVQLFTVPSVMPLLAEKRFVSELIRMLYELFDKYVVVNTNMGCPVLMTRDATFQLQQYFRVVVDLKYLLSTTTLRHHSLYTDPTTFYKWVELLILCNEMQPCKAREEESSHEVCFSALYLERHLKAITMRFMDAFITDALGEPFDYDEPTLRAAALEVFKGVVSRCATALQKRNPCSGNFRTSEDELSLFLPMHRMLAMLFDRAIRYWKFSLEDLIDAIPTGRQFVRLLLEAPLRALAMGGQVSAKLWERCSMSLLYITEHLRSEHIRRSQIEADLFILQIGAATLGGSALAMVLLNRFEVLHSFGFNPSLCKVLNSTKHTNVLIEEALDALIAVGTNRAISGRDAMEYLTLRTLVLHSLFMAPMPHSKLEKTTPKFLRPLLDDVLQEVADLVKPSDGQSAVFHVKKDMWREFDPYFVGFTRRTYEAATERYFNECSKGKPTVIPCPATSPLLRGMDTVTDIFSSPMIYSRIFWGLLGLVREQASDVMTSSGIVRCCTNLLLLSIRHRQRVDRDPAEVTMEEVRHYVAEAASTEEGNIQEIAEAVLTANHTTISAFAAALWDALDGVAPYAVSLKEELAPRLLFWMDEAEPFVTGTNVDGLRERLETPVRDANSMAFYGSDVMYNARQRFTVSLSEGKSVTHSIVSLLSAVRQMDDPRCEFAHSMVDRLLDELSEDERNKSLISSCDNGKREAEAKARLAASRELRKKKQAEIMAKFQASQERFLRESADAKLSTEGLEGEQGEGQGDEDGADEDADYCALCREQLAESSTGRSFGYVSYVQRSNLVMKVKERAVKAELEASCGNDDEESGPVERRPITQGKGIASGKEWLASQVEIYRSGICLRVSEPGETKEAEEAALEQERAELSQALLGQPRNDAGHIQSCGHKLHTKCYFDYCESLHERQLNDGISFKCPLCRTLSNILIPALPRSQLSARWSLDPDAPESPATEAASEQVLGQAVGRLALMFPSVEEMGDLPIIAAIASFLWYTVEALELEMRTVAADLPGKRLEIVRALLATGLEMMPFLAKDLTERLLRSFCTNDPRCVRKSAKAMADSDLFALFVLRVLCAPVLYQRRCSEADFSLIGGGLLQAHWVQIIHSLCPSGSPKFSRTATAEADVRVVAFVEMACDTLHLPAGDCSTSERAELVASLAKEVQARSMPFLRCTALLHSALFVSTLPVSDRPAGELLDFLKLAVAAPVPAFIENWSSGEHWRLAEASHCSVPPCAPVKSVCLPSLFQDFVFLPRFSKFRCTRCKGIPKTPAMCLLCGTIVCLNSGCCRDVVGECNIHMAEKCGSDCVFLVLQSSRVMMLRAGSSGCMQKSPYVDEYGEEDVNMSRGKELHLQEAALDRILLLLLQHRTPQEERKKDSNMRTRWYTF